METHALSPSAPALPSPTWKRTKPSSATSEPKSLEAFSSTLLTAHSRPSRRWDIVGVVPVRWSGPSFASDGPEALVEELEMTHHGFKASNV